MARIRTVKPEFQQSASMGKVGREARLTFILLWPQCDDSGRARADSRMLASLLYPYDDDAPALIDGWLAELERENCLARYEVDGKMFLQVTNWTHQKVDHPQPSKLPSPPEKKVKTRRSVREQPPKDREDSPEPREDSPLYQGSGTKDQGGYQGGASAPFDSFWEVCPRKVGKGAAEKAFTRAVREAPADKLVFAMRQYAASQTDKDPEFIAHPATWLNAKRWLDEQPAGTGPPAALRVVSSEVDAAEQENLKRFGVI